MSDPILTTTSLAKIFKDFWCRAKVRAVTDLTLSVNRGEVFGLLGPNGSGKSTTMKLLLGLLNPTAGKVSVFGASPRDTATRRRIGYLPEESQLYEQLTAAETLHFYGGLFSLGTSEIRDRTQQLLEMVGLTHAANRRVGEFSKGMARRIGLAQALINDPDLLVLDEPTAGLDPVGCRQTKLLLRELTKRGKTVILSSHLMADVEDVCDRIMLLHNGRGLATGSLVDLLDSPDRLRFSVTAPSDKQTGAISAAIRDVCGQDPDVDHPRIALETFFVDTIAGASAGEGAAPSGVAQTTRLAPFLQNS
jgi:ABC-2 type transport system ATP-binding protein